MNRVGKIALCLAGGFIFTVAARADDAALPGDPYAVVVTRNIFGLNPPPPVDPNPPDANPPPKIIPNGIISIFGHLQVLFKVTNPPQPSKTPGDDDYILSEGQRQDDIEVVKIDERNSIVTFKNHGETQELPLVATAPSSTPVATAAGDSNGQTENGHGHFAGVANQNGTALGGNSASPNNPGSAQNPGGGSGSTRAITFNAASQIPPGMTEEVQTIAIEAERERTRQQVDNGDMPPLPITDLTPSGTPEAGDDPQPNSNPQQ
jgi:hypothetical protein